MRQHRDQLRFANLRLETRRVHHLVDSKSYHHSALEVRKLLPALLHNSFQPLRLVVIRFELASLKTVKALLEEGQDLRDLLRADGLNKTKETALDVFVIVSE